MRLIQYCLFIFCIYFIEIYGNPIEISKCSDKNEKGKVWSEYCESIGGVCKEDNVTAYCECPSNQTFNNKTEKCEAPKLIKCSSEKADGKTWTDYCQELGASCKDDNDTAYCECPANETMDAKTGKCQTTNDKTEIIKCNDTQLYGNTWSEYCKQIGASCKDDNGTARCECSPNQVLSWLGCIEIIKCNDTTQLGGTWNDYCEIIGASCKDDNENDAYCECPSDKIVDPITKSCIVPAIIKCSDENLSGQTWSEYCEERGATCKETGIIYCECPPHQILNEEIGQCVELLTCNDESEHGGTWNDHCQEMGASCKDDNENPYCECSPIQILNPITGKCIVPGLVSCSDENLFGQIWSDYCEALGTRCKDDTGTAHCDYDYSLY